MIVRSDRRPVRSTAAASVKVTPRTVDALEGELGSLATDFLRYYLLHYVRRCPVATGLRLLCGIYCGTRYV